MIEPGIYFDIAEQDYRSDPALGSSDLKQLVLGAPEFWWARSAPAPEREAAHLRFGRAVHAQVLEGEAEFRNRFARMPEGALRTDDDLKAWLTARGRNNLPVRKAEKIALAVQLDPTVLIEDQIRQEAQERGLTLLSAAEFDQVLGAAKSIAANPDLASAFCNGRPEVSVFWTVMVDGQEVRLKARFDYLKVRGIGDLKTIGHTRGLSFAEACRHQIASCRYDIQAEHYLEARGQLPALVEAGRVVGDVDRDWLRDVCAEPEFGWAWVFLHSGHGPFTWCCSLSPGNPILERARRDIDAALARYAGFQSSVGELQPWLEPATMHELEDEDLPRWFTRGSLEPIAD